MPSRAAFLEINKLSLKTQEDPDFEQIIRVDDQGRGWAYIHQMLVDSIPDIHGQYVLTLDDDDMLINARAIRLLKEITPHQPPAVIYKVWLNELGILPSNGQWMRQPKLANITACGFVLRQDIFREYVPKLPPAHYASDYDLIRAVWDDYADEIEWLDMLMCWAIRRSIGRP
jgi:glycosyltransferase involved in cell wall biosynthesis